MGGVFGRLIAATPTPATYALIQHEGVGIACARATLSGGLVGLYDLMVAPEHRRQGLATDLTRARLSWAQSMGAEQAFVQMMAGNQRVQALQGDGIQRSLSILVPHPALVPAIELRPAPRHLRQFHRSHPIGMFRYYCVRGLLATHEHTRYLRSPIGHSRVIPTQIHTPTHPL